MEISTSQYTNIACTIFSHLLKLFVKIMEMIINQTSIIIPVKTINAVTQMITAGELRTVQVYIATSIHVAVKTILIVGIFIQSLTAKMITAVMPPANAGIRILNLTVRMTTAVMPLVSVGALALQQRATIMAIAAITTDSAGPKDLNGNHSWSLGTKLTSTKMRRHLNRT